MALTFKDMFRRRREKHGIPDPEVKTEKRKTPLTKIKGIGEKTAQKFIAAGIDSAEQLAEISPMDFPEELSMKLWTKFHPEALKVI